MKNSYRLCSLLDMLKFNAERFMALNRILVLMDSVYRHGKLNDEDVQRIRSWSVELKEELQKIGLRFSLMKVDEMIDSKTPGSLIEDLRSRINDELELSYFLHLSNDEARLFETESALFGSEVKDKFQSASYDIDESAKCLALNRGTASVFHAIRCLESGIKAVSRCLNIADPTTGSDRSWMKMLDAIKREIDRRWPKSGDRFSGEGQLFEGIYAALAAIQNPYRNATMHLDQKYTEEEAKHIFEMVGGLMKAVASRMDEQGLPLA